MALTVLLTALAPAAWGTTYLVTTELMPAGRPVLTALVRVLPVGILLTASARKLPSGSWWWRTALLGVLNIGAFQALLFVAAYRLPGGVAATAGAVQPLVVAALAAGLLGERFRLRTGLAGLGGIVGVGLLVLTPQAALDPVGVAAALAGTVSMATGVVLTKRWGRPVGLVTATGWQLVAGGLLLAPLAFVLEGPPPIFTSRNWLGAVWLATVGTGIAYYLWFRGIERLPVNSLSFLGLMSPLTATVLGWVVLDQSLTAGQLAGAALIAATVIATQIAGTRLSRRASLTPPSRVTGRRPADRQISPHPEGTCVELRLDELDHEPDRTTRWASCSTRWPSDSCSASAPDAPGRLPPPPGAGQEHVRSDGDGFSRTGDEVSSGHRPVDSRSSAELATSVGVRHAAVDPFKRPEA